MNQMVKGAIRRETDIFRRTNNKTLSKQKRIRSIQVKGLHMVLIFTLLLSAAFAAYKIGDFLLTWEKLDVKTFALINKPTFHTDKLERMLKQYNGNILTLSFSRLREQLLTLKEVKEVYLSRKLPSTVEIKFLLRKPVFQVAIHGKYNIIDMDGVVLYKSKKSSNELIRIHNVKTNQLETLAPYLPELSRIKDSIDYIGLVSPYGVTLKLKGRKEIFYPGENDFAAKINYYLKLRQRPLLREYNIKSVDLRFKDRFYFEYETEVNN
ncbi:MAG: FtsQ-type POTRA domain-containing protein [bacterium]|nr:FtsQ-type POTRA domain-containing protein [bacterium]